METVLFEILEAEAEDKYFIRDAKLPAIIICGGPFAKLGLHSFTVYFGRGLADWTFKTHKKAQDKALEVLSSARMEKPFKVRHEKYHGKTESFIIQYTSKGEQT